MMELNRIYHTDALSGLRMLPDGSVDCIVTSPPYWQMRDYGIAPLWWAADERCSHQPDESGYCARCGGWQGQLGQEPVREEFIAHLVSVFRECRRVLKKTGAVGKPRRFIQQAVQIQRTPRPGMVRFQPEERPLPD